MASKFMTKKDPVEVEIDYIENDGNIVIITGEAMKKKCRDKLKTLKAKFHRPNNKLFNLSVNGCIRMNEYGENFLDRNLFNDKRFRLLFIEAIDGEGEKISNTPSNIDGMIGELSTTLMEAFDEKLEQEKKDVLVKAGLLNEDGTIPEDQKVEEEKKAKAIED